MLKSGGGTVSNKEASVTQTGRCGDNVEYTLDSDGVLTISGSGAMTNYISIGNSPFYGNENIKKVIIEDGITSIGEYAFDGCGNIESIEVPSTIKGIGNFAFNDCNSLNSINVDSGNSEYTSIDGVLYNKTQSRLILCPTRKTNITIPDKVESIGAVAFKNCTGLTNITVPDSVVSVGAVAFENCTGLQSIKLSNNLDVISNGTFSGCTGLTSITIPDKVESIGAVAFENCTALNEITIPESVTSMSEDTFKNCNPLKVYCFRNSYADKYEYYPNGSEKVYLDKTLQGDADGNGVVDANDVALVMQKVLKGTRVPLENMAENAFELLDVDKDGELTARDTAYILQKTLDSTFLMPNEK